MLNRRVFCEPEDWRLEKTTRPNTIPKKRTQWVRWMNGWIKSAPGLGEQFYNSNLSYCFISIEAARRRGKEWKRREREKKMRPTENEFNKLVRCAHVLYAWKPKRINYNTRFSVSNLHRSPHNFHNKMVTGRCLLFAGVGFHFPRLSSFFSASDWP